MKKLITVISLILLATILCVVLCSCGDKKDNPDTTASERTTQENTVSEKSDDTMFDAENGKVTDTSEKGDNGAVGDVITDVSEKISEVITDVSEAAAD